MASETDQLRLNQSNQWVRAQVAPFFVFMAFMLLLQFGGELIKWDHPNAVWWQRWPEQWIYPLQTFFCIILLIKWRRYYEFQWNAHWALIGIIFGVIGIGFWLLPTTIFDRLRLTIDPEGWMKWVGIAGRKKGFDPGIFENSTAYWFVLIMRFFRAVIVVALIEEIFWRSFLARFVTNMDGNYWKQKFGNHSWKAFAITTTAFTIAHAPIDYAGAITYGAITYVLCIWSKNLGACVIMHATANLLMGCYAMAYGKYGLW
jgi:uncharacterized protein